MWFILLIIVLMVLSAELLARGVDSLNESVGQGMASGVVLGTLASLPETIVVITAVLEGKGGIALGSAIGGNVVLLTLGIGIVGIFYNLKWKERLTMRGDYTHELTVLFVSTLLLGIIYLYGYITPLTAIPLFFLYAYYLVQRVRNRVRSARINWRPLLEVVVGGAIMLVLSPLFVSQVEQLSASLGTSDTFLAMILIPVVTEVEEGVSALRLALYSKGGGSSAIVSYFGSKIQNVTLLLGIVGLLNVPTKGPFILITLISNLLGILVVLDGKLGKLESLGLSLSYFLLILLSLRL